MTRKLVLLIAVAAVIGGVIYWRASAGDDGGAAPTAAQPSDPGLPPTPPPPSSTSDNRPPPAPARVLTDDDPEGPLRLEGQVVDADAQPVAGATVTLDANPPRTVTAEDDGSFAFDRLVPRRYEVSARAGDRVGGPVRHALTADSEPVVVTVVPGASLAVLVVDADGAPVAGATVELRDDDARTETTGADGAAAFPGVHAGFVTVIARADGRGVARGLVQIPATARTTIEHRLQLGPAARVSGVVVDHRGSAVAGARVMAGDVSSLIGLGDPRRDAVVTDDRGRFALPALAAGTYRLSATHDDHAPGSSDAITVDGIADVADVRIQMAAGGVLAGVVVAAGGEPAPYATVRVSSEGALGIGLGSGASVRQSVADDRGAFRITGLARAPVVALARAESASSETARADLSATPEVADMRLVLTVDGQIAGVVVDGAGEPVAEAQVTALPDFLDGGPPKDFSLRGVAAAITDGAGKFALRGLADGSYRVRADRGTGVRGQVWRPGVVAATGDADVRLVIEADGSIAGKVQLPDGTAPTAFTVTARFPPGVPVANRTGAFTLDGVAPGTYDVTLRGPEFTDYVARGVEVKADAATDLGTIRVSVGRTAAGRVVDADGAPVAGALVIAASRLISGGDSLQAGLGQGMDEFVGARRAETDADGRFRIQGIGNKELIAAAEHAQIGRSQAVTIAGGDAPVPPLSLALVPFGSVAGQVTAGGKPAADIAVTATGGADARHSVVVKTGPDGRYLIARLPAGAYRITALLGGAGARSAGADVTVKAGERVTADVDLPLGDVTVAVQVSGVDGARIDLSQVFLFKGQVAPANAKAVQDAFLSMSASGGAMASPPAAPTTPARFEQVTPGQYSICVLPITGDVNDPTFLQRLQEHVESLRVYCQPETVAPTPLEQSFARAVPAMEPFGAAP